MGVCVAHKEGCEETEEVLREENEEEWEEAAVGLADDAEVAVELDVRV